MAKAKAKAVEELSLAPDRDWEKRPLLTDEALAAMSDREILRALALATSDGYAVAMLGATVGEGPEKIGPAEAPCAQEPARSAEMVSEAVETYDAGGAAHVVYGAGAARLWLGDEGATPVVSAVVPLVEPVPVSEKEAVGAQLHMALSVELARRYREVTGLTPSPRTLDERGEYRIEWVADGQMMQRVRLFAAGVRFLPHPRPRDMTLADVKEVARAWNDGPGREVEV